MIVFNFRCFSVNYNADVRVSFTIAVFKCWLHSQTLRENLLDGIIIHHRLGTSFYTLSVPSKIKMNEFVQLFLIVSTFAFNAFCMNPSNLGLETPPSVIIFYLINHIFASLLTDDVNWVGQSQFDCKNLHLQTRSLTDVNLTFPSLQMLNSASVSSCPKSLPTSYVDFTTTITSACENSHRIDLLDHIYTKEIVTS